MTPDLHDPRTLIAAGALLALTVLGGFALGAATESNDASGGATATPSSGASVATSPPAPPTPDAPDALVPVFLPVAEGQVAPAVAAVEDAPTDGGDAPGADGPTTDEDDEPGEGDLGGDEATTGATGDVLRPADFADGYETRSTRAADTPALDSASDGPSTPGPDAASPSPRGEDADSAAGDAAGGEDADDLEPGGSEDPPTLVDLCAVEDPPDGCDEGVLGTIWLATTVPVTIDDVVAHREVPSSCGGEPATLGDGEVAIAVTTNQPVTLQASWDYGDGGDRGANPGSTDADQAAAFDRGERTVVVTCAAVTGIAGQPTSRPVIRVEATPTEGDETAVWEQPLELGDTLVPTDVTRPERPPLQIRWLDDRRIEVWAPVGPDETALAWLVRRDPERPSMRRCMSAENGSVGPPEAIGSPPIGVRPLARSPGSDHGFTRMQQFGLLALEAGHHDLCVRWQDGPDPAPVTERAAVQLRFDELPRVEVLLAGVATTDPQPTDVTVGVHCETRTWSASDLDGIDAATPHVLCETQLGNVTGGAVLLGHRTDWGSQRGAYGEGVLRMLTTTCDSANLPACTRWYRLPVLGPDEDVRGTLTVGLRPVSVPDVEWRPRQGPVQAYGEPEPEPEHPRLEPGSVVLEPDPAGPTDTLRLRLRTVDPADVEAQLVVVDRSAEGASCAARWPRATALDAEDGVELAYDELCPGTRYRAIVTVRRPGASEPAAVYGGDPAAHDAPVLPLDVTASTDPLRLEVSATWDLLSGGLEAFDRDPRPFESGIPTSLFLRVGPAHYSFTQAYYGRAYVGLVCHGTFRVVDLGIEPTVVDVGATLPVSAHHRIHDYSGARCPISREQLARDPAPDPGLSTRDFRMRLDTAEMLREGTRVVRTLAPVVGTQYEIIVTVREPPAE